MTSKQPSPSTPHASGRLAIVVCPDPPKDQALLRGAARLSVDLGLPFLKAPRVRGVEMLLVVTPSRIELRVVGGVSSLRGGYPVWVDLTKIDAMSPAGRTLRQPIARAVGMGRGKPAPTVIDATAGYGEDTWLLASLGCHVLAVERNKIVEAMLRDGLVRASAIAAATATATAKNTAVLERIHLVGTDAAALLRRMPHRAPALLEDLPTSMRHFCPPQVVYIDPMFPGGRKAAERKPMRVLRRLVGDDPDAGQLFRAALRAATRRVVVKRPLRAEPLGDKPTSVHKGKAMRYDVYATG